MSIRTLVPILMFWALGLIWGSAFIYMKLAAALITPTQIVLLRVLFGLIPVALYAAVSGALDRGHIRHLPHLLVMAGIGTIGYYYGFAKGASLLPSGVVGALSGLTPILSFLLALLLLDEDQSTWVRGTGVALGFLGVILIARPTGDGLHAATLSGVIYTAIGSLSVGASFVYARKYVIPLQLPVTAVITYQLGLSLILLGLFVDWTGLGAIWSAPLVAAALILGLGVLGTGVAFLIYYYIIEKLGAVAASSVAYIPPVVALVIGVGLAGEEITLPDMFGAVLILLGVLLVNRKPASRD